MLARTPLRRFGAPDEMAEVALFLASDLGRVHHRPCAGLRRRLDRRRLLERAVPNTIENTIDR
ncbi:hypothetical protein ACU4GD_30385 [Cupriavidus basilensis]